MKEPFLKFEKFNDHEQNFQVTWPRTWEEQTFLVPGPELGQNRFFPSDMAQDLRRANFPCTWLRTWPKQIFSKWHGLGFGKSKLSMYLAQDLAKTDFFQVTWPRIWKEQTSMYLAQDLAITNFSSNMAHDLGRVNFPCTWPRTWPRTNFLNTWPRTWEEQTFHVPGLRLGLEQIF